MITILVIAAPSDLQKLYMETLQRAGYQVSTIPDSYTARQTLQTQLHVDVCVASVNNDDPLLALRDLSTIRRKYGIPTVVLLNDTVHNPLCIQLGLIPQPSNIASEELTRVVHEIVGKIVAARLQINDPEETNSSSNHAAQH